MPETDKALSSVLCLRWEHLASILIWNFKQNKMKKIIFFLTLGLLLMISCTKDFDEINTNPNVAEKVDPDYLFPASVLNTAKLLLDLEYEAGWTYGMYWTESGGAYVNFGTVDVTVQ